MFTSVLRCYVASTVLLVIITIMEICKAPILRLKALSRHTHIMYIEMETVIKKIYIYIKEEEEEEEFKIYK